MCVVKRGLPVVTNSGVVFLLFRNVAFVVYVYSVQCTCMCVPV